MSKQAAVLDSKLEGFEKEEALTPEELEVIKEADELLQRQVEKEVNREETYVDRLKAAGITLDEAISIIDNMVTEDFYKEDIKLSKSTIATISTRDVKFSDYLAKFLDKEDIKLAGTYGQITSKFQLAGSLVKYGTENMPELNARLSDAEWESSLNARLLFISQLPQAVFLALIRKLAKFENKVSAAMSDGYEENF